MLDTLFWDTHFTKQLFFLTISELRTTKETAVQRVFTENHFFYDVPITEEKEEPLKKICWLKPSDFLRSMAANNDLGLLLCGHSNVKDAAPVLEVFWERYRAIYPNFQLFQRIDNGDCEAKHCIPLYIHGDEGITYKRAGVLILSFQSPLGYGTSRRTQEMSVNLENLGESGLPLNFALSGMMTRVVSVICPQDRGIWCVHFLVQASQVYIIYHG